MVVMIDRLGVAAGTAAPTAQASSTMIAGSQTAVRENTYFMTLLPTGYQKFPAIKLPLVAPHCLADSQYPCQMSKFEAAGRSQRGLGKPVARGYNGRLTRGLL
jgi:hypothetical protein